MEACLRTYCTLKQCVDEGRSDARGKYALDDTKKMSVGISSKFPSRRGQKENAQL
jgi:hypothetical protein